MNLGKKWKENEKKENEKKKKRKEKIDIKKPINKTWKPRLRKDKEKKRKNIWELPKIAYCIVVFFSYVFFSLHKNLKNAKKKHVSDFFKVHNSKIFVEF